MVTLPGESTRSLSACFSGIRVIVTFVRPSLPEFAAADCDLHGISFGSRSFIRTIEMATANAQTSLLITPRSPRTRRKKPTRVKKKRGNVLLVKKQALKRRIKISTKMKLISKTRLGISTTPSKALIPSPNSSL